MGIDRGYSTAGPRNKDRDFAEEGGERPVWIAGRRGGIHCAGNQVKRARVGRRPDAVDGLRFADGRDSVTGNSSASAAEHYRVAGKARDDRFDPEARQRAFQFARTRFEGAEQYASDCVSAASGDVHRETVDYGFAARNRPAIRREASHDGAALDQQDRGDAAVGQRAKSDDYAVDGRAAIDPAFQKNLSKPV